MIKNIYGDFYTAEIEDLVGRTFTAVTSNDDQELHFECDDGVFVFTHDQDCCEAVSIDDICGDLADLTGCPILKAEEATSNRNPEGVSREYQESFTWTFYKFATVKGYVDVRWYGESNGYYSESVDLHFNPSEKFKELLK